VDLLTRLLRLVLVRNVLNKLDQLVMDSNVVLINVRIGKQFNSMAHADQNAQNIQKPQQKNVVHRKNAVLYQNVLLYSRE